MTKPNPSFPHDAERTREAIPEGWSFFVERTGDLDARALCDALARLGCASLVTVYGNLVYDVSVGLAYRRAPERLREILDLLEKKPSLIICGGHRGELVRRLHALVEGQEADRRAQLVARKTVAQAFGVSVRTLMDYLRDPTFPRPVVLESRVFFEIDSVVRWASRNGRAVDLERLHNGESKAPPKGP
jgi:predicted DNA-binding transcriptional regulator AlpA